MVTETATETSKPAAPAFSLVYGDETKLPLTIQAAEIHFEAVPSQRITLIRLQLLVVD